MKIRLRDLGGVFCVNVYVNASVVQFIFFFCWI